MDVTDFLNEKEYFIVFHKLFVKTWLCMSIRVMNKVQTTSQHQEKHHRPGLLMSYCESSQTHSPSYLCL